MIVVTGSSGFIGRAVVSRLIGQGEHVVGMDLRSAGDAIDPSSGLFTEEIVDTKDDHALDELLARHRPDTIVALAETLQSDVGSLVSGGVAGVTKVMECDRRRGVRLVRR